MTDDLVLVADVDREQVRWLWPALLSAVALSTTAVILSPPAVAKWSGSEPCVSFHLSVATSPSVARA